MIFLFSIMVVVLPTLLAVGTCIFAHRQRRRAASYVALLICIVTGFAGTVLLFQDDVFRLDSWQDNGKGSPVLTCFLIGSAVAFLPAWLVVRFYRERSRR